jgi:hypothetical protein
VGDSDNEGVYDTMNEIMAEMKIEKQKKIEQTKNLNINVPQRQKNAAKKEEDDIANILAELNN